MRRFLFIVCMLVLTCDCVFAGEYAGLTPGESTLAQANQALGEPIKVSADGLLYNYSTDGHELSELSITLAQDKNIISRIDLGFQAPYEKAQVKEWFGLEARPDSTEMIKGRLAELYLEQGIKIVHQSADENSNIIQLSHIDPDQPEPPVTVAEKIMPKKGPGPDLKKAEEYAKKADPYIEKDDYAGALPYLEKAAFYNPDKTVYSTMLSYAYLKTGRLNDAIAAAEKVADKQDDYIACSVLGNAYFQKGRYRQAIPYLEKATGFKQDQSLTDNLEFLGICYYNEARLNEALTTIVKSYKRNKRSPISTYYLAVISDRLDDKVEAKFYYKKYLALKHDNQDMNMAARQRLKVLKTSPGSNPSKAFNKALFSIIKNK